MQEIPIGNHLKYLKLHVVGWTWSVLIHHAEQPNFQSLVQIKKFPICNSPSFSFFEERITLSYICHVTHIAYAKFTNTKCARFGRALLLSILLLICRGWGVWAGHRWVIQRWNFLCSSSFYIGGGVKQTKSKYIQKYNED